MLLLCVRVCGGEGGGGPVCMCREDGAVAGVGGVVGGVQACACIRLASAHLTCLPPPAPRARPPVQIGEEEERAKAEYKEEKAAAKAVAKHEKSWEKTREERISSWRSFVGKSGGGEGGKEGGGKEGGGGGAKKPKTGAGVGRRQGARVWGGRGWQGAASAPPTAI